MTTEQETRTEVWTYLGARWTGTLEHLYQDSTGENHYFNKALTRQSPGARFTMTIKADTGSVYFKGEGVAPVYIDFDPLVDRSLLEVKHRTALTQARMAKQAKADMSQSALADLLAPIAQEYGGRNGTGRAALLGVVIEIIQSRKPKW